MVLAVMLQGISEVLPQFATMLPPGTFSALTVVVSAAAVVSRIMMQADLDETA